MSELEENTHSDEPSRRTFMLSSQNNFYNNRFKYRPDYSRRYYEDYIRNPSHTKFYKKTAIAPKVSLRTIPNANYRRLETKFYRPLLPLTQSEKFVKRRNLNIKGTDTYDKSLNETINTVKQKLMERKSDVFQEKNSISVDSSNESPLTLKVLEKKRIEHTKLSPKLNVLKKNEKRNENSKSKNNQHTLSKVDCKLKSQIFRKKILQQLFKLNNSNLRAILSNPESNVKYNFALTSLIKDTRNTLSKQIRNMAEKSLNNNTQDNNIDQEKIAEDAFLGHLGSMLDTNASVELFNLEPQVIKELSKVLQEDLMDSVNEDISVQNIASCMNVSFSDDEYFNDESNFIIKSEYNELDENFSINIDSNENNFQNDTFQTNMLSNFTSFNLENETDNESNIINDKAIKCEEISNNADDLYELISEDEIIIKDDQNNELSDINNLPAKNDELMNFNNVTVSNNLLELPKDIYSSKTANIFIKRQNNVDLLKNSKSDLMQNIIDVNDSKEILRLNSTMNDHSNSSNNELILQGDNFLKNKSESLYSNNNNNFMSNMCLNSVNPNITNSSTQTENLQTSISTQCNNYQNTDNFSQTEKKEIINQYCQTDSFVQLEKLMHDHTHDSYQNFTEKEILYKMLKIDIEIQNLFKKKFNLYNLLKIAQENCNNKILDTTCNDIEKNTSHKNVNTNKNKKNNIIKKVWLKRKKGKLKNKETNSFIATKKCSDSTNERENNGNEDFKSKVPILSDNLNQCTNDSLDILTIKKIYSIDSTGALTLHENMNNVEIPFLNDTNSSLDITLNNINENQLDSDRNVDIVSKELNIHNEKSECNKSDISIKSNSSDDINEFKLFNFPKRSIPLSSHNNPITVIKGFGSNFFAASSDGYIYYYSSYNGSLLRSIKCSNDTITCLHVKKKTYCIYVGSLDSNIRCFSLSNGISLFNPISVGSPIQSLCHAWDTLFIGTRTGFVTQLDLKCNKINDAIQFSKNKILAITALKEGPRKVLLIAAPNELITINDANTGLLLRTLYGKNIIVYNILSHSGKILCSTNSCYIQIFEFTSGELIGHYLTNSNVIVSFELYKDLLFAGCYDGSIYIFKLEVEKPIITIKTGGKMLLAMTVYNDMIITAFNDKSLSIYDIPQSVFITEDESSSLKT